MNLMTDMNFNKQDAMEQLRNGNTAVLEGLPASLTLQLGIELQKELGDVNDPSPVDFEAVGQFMSARNGK